MRAYNNFEEIDRDLMYLKLQQTVQQERLKLTLNEFKDSLAPKSVLSNAWESFTEKAASLAPVNKVMELIGRS
ncbi:MAG: DUF6327 family protein [Nonlabens sp.]